MGQTNVKMADEHAAPVTNPLFSILEYIYYKVKRIFRHIPWLF